MTAFQSAYREPHSTESALINIQNDILLNMANGLSWISLLPLTPLTTTFSLTDLIPTMK